MRSRDLEQPISMGLISCTSMETSTAQEHFLFYGETILGSWQTEEREMGYAF